MMKYCMAFLLFPLLISQAVADPWFIASEKASQMTNMEKPFTLAVRFRTDEGQGVLAGKNQDGRWERGGKVLFISGGKLAYDIGWVGMIKGRTRCDDGKWHQAVLTYRDGSAKLYLDGKLEAERKDFTSAEVADHRFKIGQVSPDFPGRGGSPYEGAFEYLKFWPRALSTAELNAVGKNEVAGIKDAVLDWKPDPTR